MQKRIPIRRIRFILILFFTWMILTGNAGIINSQVLCEAPSNFDIKYTRDQDQPLSLSIGITWTGPDNASYEYQVDVSWWWFNGETHFTSETSVSFDAIDPYENMPAYFKVRTLCADGSVSEWATVYLSFDYCPEPQNVTIVPSSDGFTMDWTYPYNQNLAISVSQGITHVASFTTDSGHIEVTGLEPNTTYTIYVEIRCHPASSEPEIQNTYYVTTTPCTAPTNIRATYTADPQQPYIYEAAFTWDGPPGAVYDYELYAGWAGPPVTGNTQTTSFSQSGIEAGMGGYFKLRSRCEELIASEWVNTIVTIPPTFCPDPENVQFIPSSHGFSMSWTQEVTPVGIELHVKNLTTNVTVQHIQTNSVGVQVAGLEPSTAYELMMEIWCDIRSGDATNVVFYYVETTPEFCESGGSESGNTYLDYFKLNDLERISGNDNGYADNTSSLATLVAGMHYTLELSFGGPGQGNRILTGWIDYNQDGDFDDTHERILYRVSNRDDIVKANFRVSPTAEQGYTRMRVIVQRKEKDRPQDCGEFAEGETEDYTVQITDSGNSLAQNSEVTESSGAENIAIYPNPVQATLTVNLPATADPNIVIRNHMGQVIYEGAAGVINVSSWSSGVYYLTFRSFEYASSIRFIKK